MNSEQLPEIRRRNSAKNGRTDHTGTNQILPAATASSLESQSPQTSEGKNKPERGFGLWMRCRELDIFNLGIFWEIVWKFLGHTRDFGGNVLEEFFERNFLGGFFRRNFLGGFFGEDFFGRNSLFTLLKSAKIFVKILLNDCLEDPLVSQWFYEVSEFHWRIFPLQYSQHFLICSVNEYVHDAFRPIRNFTALVMCEVFTSFEYNFLC